MSLEPFCPHCDTPITDRSVAMKQVTTLSCRGCGKVIEKTEGFASSVRQDSDLGDTTAIDDWTSDRYPPFAKDGQGGEFTWTRPVGDMHNEITYTAESRHVVRVSLLTTEGADMAWANPQLLQRLMAKHLLQSEGKQRTHTGMIGPGKVERCWGASICLSTYSLPPELLEPLIEKMRDSIQSVLKDLEEGRG